MADSWELLLAGSTEPAVLDSGQLMTAAKWATINEVFADQVRRTASRASRRLPLATPRT